MAAEVVQKKDGTASKVTVPSTVKGNLLVWYISVNSSTVMPKVKDNVSGEEGWTVSTTKGLLGAGGSSLWVATKTALGGETEIESIPGGGSIQGYAYFEVSGVNATVDTIVHTDNAAGVKTISSPATTTTNAGDVILAGVALNSLSGTVGVWTGAGPINNIETTNTKLIGGYLVPGVIETAATFTAKWTEARNACILLVAFKPVIPLNPAASESSASAALTAATQVPLSAAASASSAAALGLTAATRIPLSAASSESSATAAALSAATQVPLAPASSTSAASTLGLSATTQIPLASASSTSSAVLSLSARTQIPLTPAASTSSSASMALSAATQIPLAPASSTSSAPVMELHAPLLVPLNAAASSSSAATMALSAATRIALASASSTSSAASLSLSASTVIPLNAATSESSAQMTLTTPPPPVPVAIYGAGGSLAGNVGAGGGESGLVASGGPAPILVGR